MPEIIKLFYRIYKNIIKKEDEIKNITNSVVNADLNIKTNYITNTAEIIEQQKKDKKIQQRFAKQINHLEKYINNERKERENNNEH